MTGEKQPVMTAEKKLTHGEKQPVMKCAKQPVMTGEEELAMHGGKEAGKSQ